MSTAATGTKARKAGTSRARERSRTAALVVVYRDGSEHANRTAMPRKARPMSTGAEACPGGLPDKCRAASMPSATPFCVHAECLRLRLAILQILRVRNVHQTHSHVQLDAFSKLGSSKVTLLLHSHRSMLDCEVESYRHTEINTLINTLRACRPMRARPWQTAL